MAEEVMGESQSIKLMLYPTTSSDYNNLVSIGCDKNRSLNMASYPNSLLQLVLYIIVNKCFHFFTLLILSFQQIDMQLHVYSDDSSFVCVCDGVMLCHVSWIVLFMPLSAIVWFVLCLHQRFDPISVSLLYP